MTGESVNSYHDLPRWVWELVSALSVYESEHGGDADHNCACSVLHVVPAQIRGIAAIAAEWREADKAEEAEKANHPYPVPGFLGLIP